MGVAEIIALILMIIAMILSLVLRPKPIPPFAAQLSDFHVPTADAGRPVPVIFGTVLIKGPNVVWYGDLSAEPIPAPQSGASFDSGS